MEPDDIFGRPGLMRWTREATTQDFPNITIVTPYVCVRSHGAVGPQATGLSRIALSKDCNL